MPLFRARKKIFQRDGEGQDLVVRGNQILFVRKKDGTVTEMKGGRWSTTTPNHRVRLQDKTSSTNSSFDDKVHNKYIHRLVPTKDAKLGGMRTVDRGIQVDNINIGVDPKCHELSDVSNSAVKKERGILVTDKAIKVNRHKLIKVKEAKECIDNSEIRKDVATKIQQKECSFAQQLKVLADECRHDAFKSLELKNSTYLVLRETDGVVLVHFPDDLKEEESFTWENALLEADDDDDDCDELDFTSQTSVSSIEWLSSDSNSSSPFPFVRRQTLYPEPCPAFPMEVSFPPVDFD